MKFTFKIKKEHVDFNNQIYRIINSIPLTEEINADGDIEITLTFESANKQEEFQEAIRKSGLGWTLS